MRSIRKLLKNSRLSQFVYEGRVPLGQPTADVNRPLFRPEPTPQRPLEDQQLLRMPEGGIPKPDERSGAGRL